jgi:preprotein translocase subunit SecA
MPWTPYGRNKNHAQTTVASQGCDDRPGCALSLLWSVDSRNRVHSRPYDYARDVELTKCGIEHVGRVLGCGSLHSEPNWVLLSELKLRLHARTLVWRDVDYIVRNGRIEIPLPKSPSLDRAQLQ